MVDDLAFRFCAIVGQGEEAMRERMAELRSSPATAESTAEIIAITKESATTMNSVRRLTDTRAISPEKVKLALRNMTPEVRAHVLEEFGIGEGAHRSTLE